MSSAHLFVRERGVVSSPRAPLSVAALVVSIALGSGVRADAQDVRLISGEVIQGTVLSVDRNRARIEVVGGAARQVSVHDILCSHDAEGRIRWHPAQLSIEPTAPDLKARWDRLRSGDELAIPDLVLLGQRCNQSAFEDLKGVLAGDRATARVAAAHVLAYAATPETVAAALEFSTAVGAPPTLLGQVAYALMAGPALGAIQASESLPRVEQGLRSRDRFARYACAWIGTKLGSEAAVPILVGFLSDPDHHLRESAAMALAESGHPNGAKLLMAMAKRESSPAMDANRDADPATRALLQRATLRERIDCCELLGRLRHTPAASLLKTLAKHREPDLARAAQGASARLGNPPVGR